MIFIDLPLPDEKLHPNGRTRNHGYRAAIVRKHRGYACLAAKAAKTPDMPWAAAKVSLSFSLHRKRDQDGLIAWCKAYLDGLQDAGIVANDSGITIGKVTQVTGHHVTPMLTLIVEELS